MRDSIVRRSLASGRETTLLRGGRSSARTFDGWEAPGLRDLRPEPNGRPPGHDVRAGGDVSADLMTSGSVQPAGAGRGIANVVWMPSGDRLLIVRVTTGEVQPNAVAQPPIWLWEVPLTGAAPRKLVLLPLPKVEGTFYGSTSFTMHPTGSSGISEP